ncbi:IucA/IucC family protein [Catenovulum sediminis]|uniref:IucA/IucC family protein n=1 Tax=Catenovulum sediminis TaxID=1740262 RepID=A0ABV1RCM0_9ALTE|nr:IucA/IucC family protein [Catenovulum sediminis]
MSNQQQTQLQDDQSYITRRLLDACIRENVREITTLGKIIPADKAPEMNQTSAIKAEHWLKITHLCTEEIWLAVEPCDFMQDWRVADNTWFVRRNSRFVCQNHYSQWLSILRQSLPESDANYYLAYLDECDCATLHRGFARDIFNQQKNRLNQAIRKTGDGFAQMAFADQLAAHLDHPFYPTARAKFGLDENSLVNYCPEAMPSFELCWLAVPKSLCRNSQQQLPSIWPNFSDLGLPSELASSHQLVPVHPMTLEHYLPQTLADWPHRKQLVIAPKPYLSVIPTLSVRTMALVEHPHLHIKLPLPMRTLGSKNIRTIKPSTVTDGYIFQQLLQKIAEQDKKLHAAYLHCDEKQGGYVDNRADLAWILRTYPQALKTGTPVCVAAFLAQNPRGKFVIEQLAEDYYGGELDVFMHDYLKLQLSVHLRLWLKYGISLEANQQNALILFSQHAPPRLILRDNDSGRILKTKVKSALPEADALLAQFIDKRMFADNETALLQMFTTINLQLNMGCLFETLHAHGLLNKHKTYLLLQTLLQNELQALSAEGVNTVFAKKMLLDTPTHYAKYLLSAGSLLSKEKSGAASINKYYGLSAPNPLSMHGVGNQNYPRGGEHGEP